jgi:hypothetical protein
METGRLLRLRGGGRQRLSPRTSGWRDHGVFKAHVGHGMLEGLWGRRGLLLLLLLLAVLFLVRRRLLVVRR